MGHAQPCWHDPSGTKLATLEDKYTALVTLRRRREERAREGQDSFDGDENAARGAAFEALARRFPGCLRELEELDAEELEERRAAIVVARETSGVPPLWMRLVVDFHAALGELMGARAALRAAAPGTDKAMELSGWLASISSPSGVWRFPEDVALVLAPAEGRLSVTVLRALARRYGLDEAEVRLLVGRPARSRG